MIVPTTIAVARPRPMERRRLLMAYLGAHDRQRTAALAALRHLPAPRQCRTARRRPAPPLDGVRGRAPVLVRERDRRRLQRAAHADGAAVRAGGGAPRRRAVRRLGHPRPWLTGGCADHPDRPQDVARPARPSRRAAQAGRSAPLGRGARAHRTRVTTAAPGPARAARERLATQGTPPRRSTRTPSPTARRIR